MGCCTPSPLPKPSKTRTKLVWLLHWQGGIHETKQVTSGDLVLTGVTQQMVNLPLHLYTFLFPWSPQIFKLSSKYLCCSQEHPKCGSPMQFQFLAVAQGLWMTAWEAASDCTVLTFHPLLPWICGTGSTFSCPGSLGLSFYGKHLETNGWCRIQWVWKYWSEYHLILMISPFTAPKILTRLEWAARPVWRLMVLHSQCPDHSHRS